MNCITCNKNFGIIQYDIMFETNREKVYLCKETNYTGK